MFARFEFTSKSNGPPSAAGRADWLMRAAAQMRGSGPDADLLAEEIDRLYAARQAQRLKRRDQAIAALCWLLPGESDLERATHASSLLRRLAASPEWRRNRHRNDAPAELRGTVKEAAFRVLQACGEKAPPAVRTIRRVLASERIAGAPAGQTGAISMATRSAHALLAKTPT